MAKTYEELLEQAAIIRDETAAGKNTATRVGGTITDAVDYVKQLQDTYAGIHAEAAAAKTTANAAKVTAAEAKTNAGSARSIAQSALLKANSAKATADGIAATAQEAKETAAAAKTTANAAKVTAAEAKTNAGSARSIAQSALLKANSAKATADGIAATAQEAKETAAAAQTTAHEAQTTAAALLQDTPWEGRHMNMFTETGEYHIHGERTDANDGLPILNAASGHTIDARLTVLDSSLTGGTGAKTDIVVTQILRLSNRTGGDGHVYVRTAQAATKAELTATNSTKWGTWEKLMGIFEKNVVDNAYELDGYTTNGMYSGMFTLYQQNWGLAIPAGSTFLMVTINGYAVAAYGAVPQLTQMLYLLPAKTGSEQFPAKMYIRTAWWNASAKDWVWNYWDKIVTANELSALEARVTALEKK